MRYHRQTVEPVSERPTRKFCVRYYHDGQWWSLLLEAYDIPDAKARCNRLNMQLDGPLICVVPGWLPCSAFIADSICTIRNFLKL